MPATGVLRVILEGHFAAHESRGSRIISGIHVDFLRLNHYYDRPSRQEEPPRVSMHEYYQQGRRAASLGVVVALMLGVIQFLGGWFGGVGYPPVAALLAPGAALYSGCVV